MKQRDRTSNFSGIAFEKVVAQIQSQIDSNSIVAHNEFIKDRLGHRRQFDVVVRGTFGGQRMLGVIECKDTNRKVGSPEVDAFVTKAQDVNANFKIFVSRRGFSKNALEKCQHYGIQPLSLASGDPSNNKFWMGTYWEADITRPDVMSLRLHMADPDAKTFPMEVYDPLIRGKKIVDWFTNYVLDKAIENEGSPNYITDISITFDEPQLVTCQKTEVFCLGVTFELSWVCDELEQFVGIQGEGFFDWQTKSTTFAPGTVISTQPISFDFTKWKPRSAGAKRRESSLSVRVTAIGNPFVRVVDAIQLDRL